jgi:uroporphyrinogen-III synthase
LLQFSQVLLVQTHLLAGIRILVTRPAHQAQPLCDMLRAHGGQAIQFPVIKIEATRLSKESISRIGDISNLDFAIFISPNAIEYGVSQLLAQGKIPDKLQLVTIGKASALKMKQILGRSPDIYPVAQYNSEALLALDSLQQDRIKNKTVVIFRGVGGRELLAETLTRRGAKVSYAEVYRRIKPQPEAHQLEMIWANDRGPDIITLTSNEGLNNLVAMLGDAAFRQTTSGDSGSRATAAGAEQGKRVNAHETHEDSKLSYLQQLWQIPLVVVTDKMRQNAQELGFKNIIIVASKASNEAILDSVLEWAKMSAQHSHIN